MNCIARQQEKIGAGSLYLIAFSGEKVPNEIPSPFTLSTLDFLEVGLGEHDFRAVQPGSAQTLRHEFINYTVVHDRARPRDTADYTYGFQSISPEVKGKRDAPCH
jgi:hypothetical protein